MTTVTSCEYCAASIRWWFRPNKAEIEPNVSQERQQHRPQGGQEAGERCLLDVFANCWQVAEHGADDYLDKGDRDPNPDADQRGGERHRDPDCGDEAVVHQNLLRGSAGVSASGSYRQSTDR
jgi:hypothetical protein